MLISWKIEKINCEKSNRVMVFRFTRLELNPIKPQNKLTPTTHHEHFFLQIINILCLLFFNFSQSLEGFLKESIKEFLRKPMRCFLKKYLKIFLDESLDFMRQSLEEFSKVYQREYLKEFMEDFLKGFLKDFL